MHLYLVYQTLNTTFSVVRMVFLVAPSCSCSSLLCVCHVDNFDSIGLVVFGLIHIYMGMCSQLVYNGTGS